VGSPFAYEEQGLLYCPVTIADPRSERRDGAVADELERLIAASGGRTLALFTTVRLMRHHATVIAKRLPFRVLVQDDMPRAALIEAFESDETSCLFATSGFFQGIDIPGRTLSLVVIDKIPFPRPDDPLLEARRETLGKGAFGEIDLPRAATMLAQAAGRLIRSNQDRGVVAILDPRLANKPYGSELVATLPPFRRTKRFEEVSDFLTQSLK
jgi:ATP-dependent DNA helicase DinG